MAKLTDALNLTKSPMALSDMLQEAICLSDTVNKRLGPYGEVWLVCTLPDSSIIEFIFNSKNEVAGYLI